MDASTDSRKNNTFHPYDERELREFRRKVLDLLGDGELPRYEIAQRLNYDHKKLAGRLKDMVQHKMLFARLSNERFNGSKVYYYSKDVKQYEADVEMMNWILFGKSKPYKVNYKYAKKYLLENKQNNNSGLTGKSEIGARSYYSNMAIFPAVEY